MMWNPWNDFDRTFLALDELRRRMDYVFGDLGLNVGDDTPRDQWAAGRWPQTHVQDLGSEIVLTALVPGMSDKDVSMTATADTLTVSGERKADVPEGYSVHRQERGHYRFARSFALPAKIDPERVSAELSNGVLTVRMAKAAEATPRQITVKATA